MYRYGRKVDSVDAAQVDRGHAVALRVRAFAVWMDAAGGAEAMLDRMLVEGVGAGGVFRGEQGESVAGDEPEQRSFTRADRAVAGQGAVDVAFELEDDVPAVAASFASHGIYLLRSIFRNCLRYQRQLQSFRASRELLSLAQRK